MRELSGAIHFARLRSTAQPGGHWRDTPPGIASVFRITLAMRVEELTSRVPEGRTQMPRTGCGHLHS